MKCPLCNSDNTKLLYKTNINNTISQIDNRDIQIREEIRKVWGGDNCKFMKCNKCSFSFAYPFKSGTNKLYSLIYTNNYPTERWEYDLALKEIISKDICLEIGAGTGMFSRKLEHKCKKENIYSVEISNDKSNYKNINEIPNDKKFSVVCMFQVLEHLDNFKEVINKINIITTDDAKLIISVPHGEKVEFFRKTIGLGDNPPIHVSRWNKKTISRLEGWEIKDYKIKVLSKLTLFKYLFYGTRTRKYPGTRNPFLLMNCFFNALIKMKSKRLGKTQYFSLTKK